MLLQQFDFVSEAFAGFVICDETSRMKRWELSVKEFESLVAKCKAENQDALIPLKCLVDEIYSGKYSARRLGVLLEFLNHLVSDRCYSARQICEVLLSNSALTPQMSSIWVSIFRFIDANLCNVDYKGCRELLKLVMEKASVAFGADSDGGRRYMPQLQATYNLIAKMLDRRSYFLPSYIAANTVKSDDRLLRHWKFSSLLQPFLSGFRPIADILTPTGRCHYNPIVGFSSIPQTLHSAWHLSPTLLRFHTNGPLPYRDEAQQPQTRLFSWLLKHTYPREVISAVLLMPHHVGQGITSSMVEQELASLLVEFTTTKHGLSSAELRLWQHLFAQTFVIKNQLPSVTFATLAGCIIKRLKSVLQQAYAGNRIRGNRYKRLGDIFGSRDCLMFILAQYIAVQKGGLDEHLPVFEIYDVLYNYRPSEKESFKDDGDTTSSSSDDEEPSNSSTWRPPFERRQSSPSEFIYGMAPANLWHHFSSKLAVEPNGFCPPRPDQVERSEDKLKQLQESLLRNPPGPGALAAGGASANGEPPLDVAFIAVANEILTDPSNPLATMFVDSLQQSTMVAPIGIEPGSTQDQQQLLALAASWSTLRAPNNIRPISMARLDLLGYAARTCIMHRVLLKFHEVLTAVSQGPTPVFPSPALLETGARLLAYHELEASYLKKMCERLVFFAIRENQPTACFMFLQVFTYRMPNLTLNHRHLLLKALMTIPATSSNFTLYNEFENTVLSVVNSMTPVEFVCLMSHWYQASGDSSGKRSSQNQQQSSSSQNVVAFQHMEDINRTAAWKFVINLRMAGADPNAAWAREAFAGFKTALSANSLSLPLSSDYLAAWLPQQLIDVVVRQAGAPSTSHEIDTIKRSLVAEVNKYSTYAVSQRVEYAHQMSQSAVAVFYCLVCRLISESRGPSKVFCIRCLDKMGQSSRSYSVTLPVFIEFLVDELANSPQQQVGLQKFTPIVNEMIYKLGLFPIDRFILALVLTAVPAGSNQDLALLNMIASLVSSDELLQRISGTVAHYTANHWLDGESFAGHTKYHSLFPEPGLYDPNASDSQQQPMPVYFGNCCIRLIRNLDYCFYRWLPLSSSDPQVAGALSKIVESVAQLYAFHPKPLLFVTTALYLVVDQLATFTESIAQLCGKLTVSVLCMSYFFFIYKKIQPNISINQFHFSCNLPLP